MKIKFASFFVLAVFFICIGSVRNVYAQNEAEMKTLSERIDKATKKLQLKLLLDQDQLIKVDSILVESLPKSISMENKQETQKLINAKIESVLTKRQKTKFNILKSNWLDEIISTSE